MSVRRRTRRALVTWAVGAAVMRLTLWAPEVCPPIARSEARLAATQAADWIVVNQGDDGQFLYDFHRGRDETGGDYNLVRHAGVTMSLYQMVRSGEIRYLDAAERGLAWMLQRLETTDGGGRAFTDGNRAKLGASSLLAVSLAQRRLATADPQYDQLMQDLGEFILEQQRPDGSMLNFHDIDAGPVPDETSVFATGEALWALALLHELFPQRGFEEPAWLTLDYMATARDRDEDIFPQPWPDQWAAYSLGEMAEWGLADHHITYARRLLERFAMIVRFDAQRGSAYGSITHGPAPRGGGVGTWLEGLGALRPLTITDQRLADLEAPVEDALACGAGRLAERQVEPGEGVTPQEAGAWFYDDLTRMDDQQHAASGLLLSLPVLP